MLRMAAPLVVSFWMRSLFTFVDTIYAATVTHDLFKTLGVEPMMGRGFTLEEEEWNKNWASVVISHKVWTERYQSDSH